MLVFDSELIDLWNKRSEGSGEPLCWILPFKARNFSEGCSSLWAQFKSNEVETLWPALHEVQTGWPSGLSDFCVLRVYAARAKMPSPCCVPCHAIPAIGSTWSGAWLSSSTGSSPSCLCQCGCIPSSGLWHSSSPSPGCFVSLSRQETILF